MRRSKYNQEFKDSAVKLCIDSDKLAHFKR